MNVRSGAFTLIAILSIASTLAANTVRAPLIGHVLPASDGVAWFSETRIWNPNQSTASVVVTDVIGLGNPTRRNFTVPPNGILNLRTYELFFDTDPPAVYYPLLLALVEFTSDQPIRVYTMITAREPAGAAPGIPPPFPPHFGGDARRPLAGPVLRGFKEYFPPGVGVGLGWLTADHAAYRNNLFFTNPTTELLTVSGTFRSRDGDSAVVKTYQVPPRSQLSVMDALASPEFESVLSGAMTVTFVGDRPFYVFAAVVSDSLAGGVQPVYTLVQPEIP
jgi:hypothetical protein